MFRQGSIILLISLLSSVLLCAQSTTIYEAGISVDGVTYSEPGNSFNHKVFFKSKGQRLNLTSAFIKASFSNSAAHVCTGYFFYRLYREGNTAPAFNRILCSVSSDLSGGAGNPNQFWQNNSINLNLIKNLDTGRYTIEVYYGADASPNSSECTDILFYKNNGAFFTATIVVTPPLNILFKGFITTTDNKSVVLHWEIQQVISDLQYFILEKSHNGVNWQIMDTVYTLGTVYAYKDLSPFEGVNFYQVRAAGFGKTHYSIVRRINVGYVENIITIYPNPVYKNIRFQMTAIIKGQYDLVIHDASGARITSKTISHDGNDNYVTMPLPSTMNRGMYWLVVYGRTMFYKRSFMIE